MEKIIKKFLTNPRQRSAKELKKYAAQVIIPGTPWHG
jgi:hypothetical protein